MVFFLNLFQSQCSQVLTQGACVARSRLMHFSAYLGTAALAVWQSPVPELQKAAAGIEAERSLFPEKWELEE